MTSTDKDRDLAAWLIEALERDNLLLVLQPIVDAASSKPVLFEALLRLKAPDGKLISAAGFMEDAERLGLAPRIDKRALELALPIMQRHPVLKLSLNVSTLTAEDADWLAALRLALANNAGLADRLTIEITETAMIRDLDAVAGFVDMLRGLGCKVAIDDFGAGYTSFRYLKALHVDVLKIDGTFVKNLPDDHKDLTIVKTMIDMAKALGLVTVAEWVGDERAASILRSAGANMLQGYYFGQPTPVEDLERAGAI